MALEVTALAVGIDSSRAKQGAAEFRRAVDDVARGADNVEKGTQQAGRGMEDAGRSAKRAKSDVEKLTSEFKRLAAAALAYFGGRELVQLADSAKLMEGRLRLATTSAENLAVVQARLVQVAKETRSSYEDTVDLFTRTARAAKALGVSQQDVLEVTKAVNQAFQISGATAGEAQSAVRQLGQALAAGQLRGDELTSVLENAPRLAEAIAEKFGVTAGQLRILAAEGKLLSRDVFEAIREKAGEINQEFANVPLTIGQAGAVARNNLLLAVGEFDKATGASDKLAKAIIWVSENVRTLATLMASVAAVWVVSSIPRMIASLVALVAQLKAATAAMRTFALANPWTAAIVGITAVGGAIATFLTAKANEARQELAKLRNDLRGLPEDALKLRIAAESAKVDALRRLTLRPTRAVSDATGTGASGGNEVLNAQEIDRQLQKSRQTLSELNAALKDVQALNASLPPIITNLGTTTDEAGKKVKTMVEHLSDFYKEMGKLEPKVIVTDRAMQGQIESIRVLDEFFAKHKFEVVEVGEAYDDLGESVGTAAEVWKEAARQIQNAFQNAFESIFENGLKGFADFAQSVLDILKTTVAAGLAAFVADRLESMISVFVNGAVQGIGGLSTLLAPHTKHAQLIGAAGGGLAGFGVGLQSGNVFGGALGGAATGFAVGGPAGAIVGGIGGAIGGLIGLGSKAEQIQKQYDETNAKFAKSFDDFLKSVNGFYDGFQGQVRRLEESLADQADQALSVFRGSPLGREIRDRFGLDLGKLREIFEKEGVEGIKRLRDGLEGVVGSTEDIDLLIERLEELGDAGAEALKKLQEAEALRQTRRTEDLGIELGRTKLEGVDDLAATRALEDQVRQLEQQRRMADAVADGWTDAQLELLRLIQAEQNLGVERRRAAEDAEKLAEQVRTREDFQLDLIQRRAKLSGDAEQIFYAEMYALQQRNDRELEAAQKLLDAGTITQEMFDELAAILGDEVQSAVDAFNESMDDTAEAAARAARILQENANALLQQFDVFETGLDEQIAQLGDLYGLGGKSIDELQKLFTKVTPGVELTPEEKTLNDQIAQLVRLIRQRDAAAADAIETVTSTGTGTTRVQTSTNGTVYTGPVTVQVILNVDPETLQDADRTADEIVERVNRLLAGDAAAARSAAGRY